ncbi:MAG: hypothetical protein IPN58_00885 [Anaerolineales bacterium]|nr:hypothetical protein [Anaerolineales bacterium]
MLKGETRSLAQKGSQALRETKRLGIKVIAELSSTQLETLTEETIGFTFAPRLNALGRLGDANPAVELLLTQDPARARLLAAQIEGLNSQRRLLTSNVYLAAEAQLKANPDLLTEPVIVLSHPNWPGGVVGIVANKLVDRYHKPAILLNESEDGIMRGSARSIEGLHITEAIATQKDILRGFGGHPMAAGMSFDADKLIEFRKGLGKAIEKQLGTIVREEATLQIDAWLDLNELNLELANSLEMLAPFGAGNPALTLATRNVSLRSVSTIGKTKEHLRLTIEDEGGNVQSILWWGGAGEEKPEEGSKFDISYSCEPVPIADKSKSHCSLKNSGSLKKSLLKFGNQKSKLKICVWSQPACWRNYRSKLPHSKFGLKARRNQKAAAAMASRESAIEFGLQWLAAAGHASVSVEDDAVTLSAEKPEANPYLQKELYLALRGILNEISAYRKYFATVEHVAGLFEVH